MSLIQYIKACDEPWSIGLRPSLWHFATLPSQSFRYSGQHMSMSPRQYLNISCKCLNFQGLGSNPSSLRRGQVKTE